MDGTKGGQGTEKLSRQTCRRGEARRGAKFKSCPHNARSRSRSMAPSPNGAWRLIVRSVQERKALWRGLPHYHWRTQNTTNQTATRQYDYLQNLREPGAGGRTQPQGGRRTAQAGTGEQKRQHTLRLTSGQPRLVASTVKRENRHHRTAPTALDGHQLPKED